MEKFILGQESSTSVSYYNQEDTFESQEDATQSSEAGSLAPLRFQNLE